ncbi:MAG: AtpZ/AtpI family protein [Oscillospiraceae bacterium]|nr:AtpZ/AtpI family protein [Oscillospiraceae bacterium]
MARNKKDFSTLGSFAKAFALLSQIGITVAVCVAIGVFLGRWLDGLLGTSPWLLLVCSLLGVGAGVKYIMDLGNR